MFGASKNKTKIAVIISLLLGAFLFFELGFAVLPQEIFFQARLAGKNGNIVVGRHKFKFRLYTSFSGSSPIWNETQSLVSSSLGIFSCYMGSVTSFPADMNFNSLYYLSVEVDNDGEMSPRLKLVPALNSLNTRRLDGLSSSQFLRSDVAMTMAGPLTFSNYLSQTYSGTNAGAMNINYNPAFGTYNAMDVTYGAGGGTGVALKITQNGKGDILQVYDSSTPVLFIKANGNVGIGTNTPAGLLQVGEAASAGLLVTSSGNVGVGTLSPAEKLEVKGVLKATSFSGDGSGLTGISGLISNLTAGRLAKASSATSITDSLIIESGSNIGIGISNPTARLHVSGSFVTTGNVGIGTLAPAKLLDVAGGSIRTDNQFISTVTSGTAPLVVSSATLVINLNADKLDGYDSSDFISSSVISSGFTNYLAKYTTGNTIGASTIIYDNGSNVGIGTTSPPIAKLQVNGAVYASAFFDDASAVSADTNQAYLNSSLGTGLIKITTGSGALSIVSDNSSQWDTAYANRISSVLATAPLTVSFSNNVLSTSISQANISGDGYLSSLDWNTFNNKQDSLFFSTGLSNYSNIISADLSCGVNGGQSVVGGIASGENLILNSTLHAAKGKIILGSASAYDHANDKLGVGTTVPSAKLEIVAAGTGTGLAFRLRDNSGEDKLVVLDNGNVGFGIVNPKHKFEVVGDVKITGVLKQGGSGDLAEMIPFSACVAQAKKDNVEFKPAQRFFRKKKKSTIYLDKNQEYNNYLFGRPEAGDVVVVEKDSGIRRSYKAFATNAVGIISTRPAQLLRYDMDNAAPVALSGIVPCKVTSENGAIEPGDLLVCSSVPGHAMNAGNRPPVGSVIGKALGKLSNKQKEGIIEVLVTLK
ncbi:MAG: hypothetical protein ABIG31_05760 [Candidatus Omnitrophota bacterium]